MQTITPTPQRLIDAHSIVSQPDADHSPRLRLLAWATLKAARGQIVHQTRIITDFTARNAEGKVA